MANTEKKGQRLIGDWLLYNQIRPDDVQWIGLIFCYEGKKKIHPGLFSLYSKSQRKISFIKTGCISNDLPHLSSGGRGGGGDHLAPQKRTTLRKWDWIPSLATPPTPPPLSLNLVKGRNYAFEKENKMRRPSAITLES